MVLLLDFLGPSVALRAMEGKPGYRSAWAALEGRHRASPEGRLWSCFWTSWDSPSPLGLWRASPVAGLPGLRWRVDMERRRRGVCGLAFGLLGTLDSFFEWICRLFATFPGTLRRPLGYGGQARLPVWVGGVGRAELPRDGPVGWTHFGPSVGIEIRGCERSGGTPRRWVGKTAGPWKWRRACRCVAGLATLDKPLLLHYTKLSMAWRRRLAVSC